MAAFGAIASETEGAADVRHVSPAVFEDGAWRCEPIADRATADADAGERGDASGEAAIPAGERCAAIEIAIADDADVEPAREWFAVELELRQPHSRSARLRRTRIPVAVLEGVCDRTPAVRDALLAAAAAGPGCERPAPADLTPIQTLALDGPEPAAMLAAGDLSGLPGLRTLDLRGNALTGRCQGGPCWRGFELAAGDPLTLFARPPRALATPEPEALFGDALRLRLASLAAPGDADGELAWRVSSSDPAVAAVRIVDGTLVVEPQPGAEGTVLVEATATDANGLATTIRFEVQVDFHWPPRGSWRNALPLE